MYYETTHWVMRLEWDATGQPWYLVSEDKWKLSYYIPASHARIVSIEELTPISSQVPIQEKRIEVRTAEQVVVAYEYDRPVFMARTATGARFSNGDFSTPPGRHITAHKRPSRHMAAGNLAANGYDLPGVPWITYITESGISFHGTYWHNNFGRPRSHGCINLTPKAARWIYRWTYPQVPPQEQFVYEDWGTIVDVI
jgi:lipoprotein-anchoring transpeptidase ErfK/SrfK